MHVRRGYKMKNRGTALIPEIDLELSPGDQVLHKTFGRGTVLAEWGSFTACRNCTNIGGTPGGKCQHCGQKTLQVVSGKGIFEIKFYADGKTRSINQTWLKKL